MVATYLLKESLPSSSEFLRVPKEFISIINSYPNGADFVIKLDDSNGVTEVVNYKKTAELGNNLIKVSRGQVRNSFPIGSKISITPLSEKTNSSFSVCGCGTEEKKDYSQCISNKLDHIQEVVGNDEECKASLLTSLSRELLKVIGKVVSFFVQIPFAIFNGILFLILTFILLVVIGILFVSKVIVTIYQWIRDFLLCGCPSLKCTFDLIEFVVGKFVNVFDFIACFIIDATNIPVKIVKKGVSHKVESIEKTYSKFYKKLHPIFCCKDEFCS